MTKCRVCKELTVEDLLHFGNQPISNRFLHEAQDDELTHPLQLGHCTNCQVLQLIEPISADATRPHFDWIKYNEPSRHLSQLVHAIQNLPGISPQSRLFGISGFEAPLFQLLNQVGFAETHLLNLSKDLEIKDSLAGLETKQALNPVQAKKIVAQHGRFDVVVARYLLEHVHDLQTFFEALHILMQEEGYLIVEVPDITRLLKIADYSSIWEEHIYYFTPYTLVQTLERLGLSIHSLHIYPYTMENSLVAIARPQAKSKFYLNINKLHRESQLIKHYQQAFTQRKQWYQQTLAVLKKQYRIAIFGAGHLACHFMNLLGLEDHIDFVIDDHPHKKGMYMPGSRLPILSSDALRDIDICLMSLSPESEQKILHLKQDFILKGGRFWSIFATSPYALEKHYHEVA